MVIESMYVIYLHILLCDIYFKILCINMYIMNIIYVSYNHKIIYEESHLFSHQTETVLWFQDEFSVLLRFSLRTKDGTENFVM